MSIKMSAFAAELIAEIKSIDELKYKLTDPDKRTQFLKGQTKSLYASISKIIQKHTKSSNINLKYLPNMLSPFITSKFDANKSGLISKHIQDNIRRAPGMPKYTIEELEKYSKNIHKHKFHEQDVDPEILGCFDFTITIHIPALLNAHHELSYKIADFTPEEVTAIILHEVGHSFGVVKRILSTKYNLEVHNHHLLGFAKYAPKEEQEKFRNMTVELVKKSDSKDVRELAERIESIEKEIEYIKNNPKTASKFGFSFFKALDTMANIFIFTIANIAWASAPFNKLNPVGVFLFHTYPFWIEYFLTRKESSLDDFARTKRSIVDEETRADDFVAKHGLGNALYTSLVKIEKSISIKGWVSKDSATMYYLFIIEKMLGSSIGWMTSVSFWEEHNNDLIRAGKIKQSLIKYLKDSSLPPDVKAMYLSSIEDLDKSLDEISFRRVKEFLLVIRPFNTKQEVVNLRQIDKLKNIIEDFQHNPLYIDSARLES